MRRILTRVALCCVGLVLCSPAFANQESSFRAGAATSNITPMLGGAIVGGFSPLPSKQIHDELYARCIVMDDGQTKIALVVCDVLGISLQTCREARLLVEKNTGIPASNVLVCATHTHSATSVLGQNRFRDDLPLDEYQQFIVRRIADGVQRANNLLRPAEFAFGTVDIPDHVFNRRWYLKPGTMPLNPFGNADDKVKMNPGAGSPNLLEPAGPTDPAVSIISLREKEGAPIALLASYSLHYVGGVPSTDISSDYFGRFSEHVLDLMGNPRMDPPFVPILANGTSGDINNINFREPRPRMKPYEQMNIVARDVAEKVLATVKELKYDAAPKLAASFSELDLKYREPDAKMLAWAEKTVAAGPQRPTDLSFVYAQRTRSMADAPEKVKVPLQVLKIGQLCIGTMPCEVFSEIGLEFKKTSPIQPAFLMSLSHGYLGYLPPPRQLDLGGYETWMGTNRLEREASDKMLQKLIEMTKEIQAAAAPAAAPKSL
jgi:neutral ceramidase